MHTNFFCTNFLNTPRGPGHPGKIPGTSQIPLFETPGRQTFEGGHEVFGRRPFEWKTPTPPGGLRTQKVYLRALFSSLILCWAISAQGVSKNIVGNCVLIFYGFLPALSFHLQCYRLWWFSFARKIFHKLMGRTAYKRGIGVRAKGVTRRDAIVPQ